MWIFLGILVLVVAGLSLFAHPSAQKFADIALVLAIFMFVAVFLSLLIWLFLVGPA